MNLHTNSKAGSGNLRAHSRAYFGCRVGSGVAAEPHDIHPHLWGTQPVCVSAPNIDPESVLDVCIDRAKEGTSVVSGVRGSPVEGDPSRIDLYDERFFD